jgi:hypothetical protein
VVSVAFPINDKDSLRVQMREVLARPAQTRPIMLGFLIFDERKSHEPIKSFIIDEYSWLDSLARMSQIVLFFFQAGPRPGQDDQTKLATAVETKSTNPSLEIAAKFGIGPDELPGIVFFHDLDLDSVQSAHGLYWQLPIDSFREDRIIPEKEFARLFAMVRKAQASSSDAASMMEELKTGLRRARTSEPFMVAVRGGLMKLVTYPGKLIEAFLVAFGEGMGQGFAGKI